MTIAVAERALSHFFSEKQFTHKEKVVLDFIGGEPFLEVDLIDDIIQSFLNKASSLSLSWVDNYSIRITTNGLLYSSAKVQSFIKKYHKHLNVSISIDGTQKKHDACRCFETGEGSYAHVIKSIPLWREQFPNEGTKMTISHGDVPYVFESIKHLISLGIYLIDVNPVLENVWDDNDAKILEEQLVRCADYIVDNGLYDVVNLSCFNDSVRYSEADTKELNYGSCGSFTFAVNYNGQFYSCLRFAEFSLREKNARPIGDVETGVNWNLMRPFKAFCNAITSDACHKCNIYSSCKTCPAENYDSSSSETIYQQSLAACKMHLAKVRANNYFRNKLFSQYNG